MVQLQLVAGALAGALLVSACARKDEAPAAPAEPAVDLAAEEQAIRNRSAEWMNFANANDVATIVGSVYSPDAVVIYDGDVQKGSAEIQAILEQGNAESPDALISWSTTSVNLAESGDMALELGELTVDPDGEGKKPATMGSYVTVWQKTDGQWRVIADAGTEDATKPAP